MEFLQITLTGWVALSIALSMALLAGIMFFLGTERLHYIWGIFCVAVAIWAGGFYMVTQAQTAVEAQFWWKVTYIGLILNPFLYFQFALEFVQNRTFLRNRLRFTLIVNAAAAIFLYFDLATNLIIDKVTVLFGKLYYNTPPGPAYLYFMVVFPTLICVSLFLIIREYRKRRGDSLFRQRAVYFFIASAIAYIGGSMNFLPIYGVQINPITNFAVAFGALFIAYAILKQGLFDVKVATAQFLTLILMAFSLIRVFISTSNQELTFSAVFLAVTSAVGIYLILSIRREISQREEIQKLVSELQETNRRQEALIHFIGHEVKGFLTKAEGAFAALCEEDFGPLPDYLRTFVQDALKETRNGATSVSDILKAANIKRGTVAFEREAFDLKKLVAEEVERERPFAEERSLTLSFDTSLDAAPFTGDRTEIGDHVLRNLIENSIYYTPEGSVEVLLKRGTGDSSAGLGPRYVITVKDTGVGISAEDKEHLFTEGGHGKESRKINAHSTGYGLFIAKQVVDVHKGAISVDSAGPGKGSTFTVELPIQCS